MEFGKIDDLRNVHWDLPINDQKNKLRLDKPQALSALSVSSGGPSEGKIFLGSPAWGNSKWIGKIYPPQTTSKKFLYYYSRHFQCIELNTSHYRIPSSETVENWLNQVSKNFLFCPKVYKEISHSRLGLVDQKLIAAWLKFLSSLKDHLGPCFIQFSENFSYQNKIILFKFLESWPSEFQLTLELRHASWFDQGKILPALGDYLSKKNIGLVITDVAGRRDVLHSSLSSEWSMIRLVGNNLHASDSTRLEDWARRIIELQKDGLKKTFLFLHQPDDLLTVEFARLAQKIFSHHGYKDLPTFEMPLAENLTLFD